MNKSKWIKFNVGGQIFQTTKTTLLKEPESMLVRMFEGELPSDRDEQGAILIDRSPKYFEPLLNYLRTGKLMIDPGLNEEGVLAEAEYYLFQTLGINYEKKSIKNDSPTSCLLKLWTHLGIAAGKEFWDSSYKKKVRSTDIKTYFEQFGPIIFVLGRSSANMNTIDAFEIVFANEEDAISAINFCSDKTFGPPLIESYDPCSRYTSSEESRRVYYFLSLSRIEKNFRDDSHESNQARSLFFMIPVDLSVAEVKCFFSKFGKVSFVVRRMVRHIPYRYPRYVFEIVFQNAENTTRVLNFCNETNHGMPVYEDVNECYKFMVTNSTRQE